MILQGFVVSVYCKNIPNLIDNFTGVQMDTKDQQPNPQKKGGLLRTTGKVFYYGLAIDSINRSVGRLTRLTKNSGASIGHLVKMPFKRNAIVTAQNIDEVIATHNYCAQAILGAGISILTFLIFTFFLSSNMYGLICNALLTTAFTAYLFIKVYVYLKCKIVIQHYDDTGEFLAGDNT